MLEELKPTIKDDNNKDIERLIHKISDIIAKNGDTTMQRIVNADVRIEHLEKEISIQKLRIEEPEWMLGEKQKRDDLWVLKKVTSNDKPNTITREWSNMDKVHETTKNPNKYGEPNDRGTKKNQQNDSDGHEKGKEELDMEHLRML